MAKRLLSVQKIVNLSSDPQSGTAGEIYYNTSLNAYKYYNGTTWTQITGGGGLSNVVEDTSPELGGNLDASSFNITNVDNLSFDTTPDNAGGIATLVWDDGEGTLKLGLKGGNVSLQLGQENVALCYNGTGSTISNGSVVYITGAQGQRPSVALADADTESTSSKTFGIATEDISNGAEGFVATFGIVNGVNTAGFTAGQALWLSSTAGQLTNVKPSAPTHAVFVGYCLHVNSSSGRIFVNPQNGYEVNELHDVLITSIADNHILSYDNATSLWKNQSLIDAIKEVDGAGTGLDADLLDGQHGSYYLDWTNTTNKPDPTITLAGDLSGSVTLTDLASGTLTATVADDSHNHTTSTITNFTEDVQDVVGGMVSTNTESGISVTYDDTNGKLDFNVNDPTISLTGDVTGSATMTDLGNVSIATTIAANSVALGTDTTGNYVATIAGTTNQISVTGSGSETAAVTLSTPQDIHTAANPTFAGATLDSVRIGITAAGEIDTTAGNLTLDSTGGTVLVDDNLSVTGDLTVNGTTTTVNSTTVTVDDPIITLGGDTAPTVDDNKDRGIEFRYFDTAARLGFMGYDDSAGQFVFLTAATNTSEVFSGTKGTIDANISGSNINAGTVSATYIDAAIARLASPTFTGTPAAPTAAADTNTTQIATTAYVIGQGYLKSSTASSTYAPLASPTFTGTVTAATLDLTTAATATTATSYWVETGSDGVVRPKTLANVRTEIVTTAAVNSAAATTVGTITSGVWQGSSISTTYTDAKVTSVNGSTGAITGLATTAATIARYSLGSNSATAEWVKLGTFTAAQSGQTIEIKIVSHAGYNAQDTQNQTTFIYFKTSNGSSVDSNGFAGDGYYWSVGRNTTAPSQVKIKSNAAGVSATSYDIFAYVAPYSFGGTYSVQVSPSSTWTHTGNYAQADPGSASSTVAVLSNSASHMYVGKINVLASSTNYATLNIPHGTAPTAPTNGDIWTTTAGVYARINGATVGPLAAGGGGDSLSPFLLGGM